MKHILLIDPVSELVIKKDSSIQLAISLKNKGHETYLLFEDDFYFCNSLKKVEMNLYEFDGKIDGGSQYVSDFRLGGVKRVEISGGDVFHMRIDPPFDTRYLRYLWMLKALKNFGVRVINDPEGILLYNEKLYAYEQKESLETYIGKHDTELMPFLDQLEKKGYKEVILKPLDLYQGIGVEKFPIDQAKEAFLRKTHKLKGPVVVQPFCKDVQSGEVRSVYFNGVEIGNILKVPPKGDYLANIARGASYNKVELTDTQRKLCERICQDLLPRGVNWIAFDILGDHVSEVNITCPGLLVEVSSAYKENLADKIIDLI